MEHISLLILSRAHEVALIRSSQNELTLPSLEFVSAQYSYDELHREAVAIAGQDLGGPAGSRAVVAGQDFPRHLCYVAAGTEVGRSWRGFLVEWVPLRSIDALLLEGGRESFWTLYEAIMLGGYKLPAHGCDVFAFFGGTLESAARLAHCVVKGSKRATCGQVEAYKASGEALPSVGAYSVVTDGYGIPLCLIRTKEVRVIKFLEVSAELAAMEGEGDLSLDYWRKVHGEVFAIEAESLGFSFVREEAEVCFEIFEVEKVFVRYD